MNTTLRKKLKQALKTFEKQRAQITKPIDDEIARLEGQIEELRKAKSEMLCNGDSTPKAKRSTGKRKSYPELTVEAVKKFIGANGKSVGELVKHFGTKFSTAANQKLLKGHFNPKKEGVSVIWKNK